MLLVTARRHLSDTCAVREVLVIDDDRDLAGLLAQSLAEEGFAISTAQSETFTHTCGAASASGPFWRREGAQGYFERFGSAYGAIVVRGSAEFGLGTLFREDLRRRARFT